MSHDAALDRKDLLLSVLMIFILIIVGGGMGVYVLSDPGIKISMTLVRAAQVIDEEWMEPVDHVSLVESGRDGMFSLLDRYSGYVDGVDFGYMQEELSGSYGGIGVSIVPQPDGLLVMSVRENGPAAKVGLLSGDLLIAADSVLFRDLVRRQPSELLRGKPGTDVLVRVYRPVTEDTIEVTMTREAVPLQHIPYAGVTNKGVLYIRLLNFDSGASDELRTAVDSLLETAADPAGLILDLRSNPGGLFTEAYRAANLFLNKGAFIVGTDARSRWNEEEHYALYGDMTDGLPMAVLVDRGSASASEIVAGALQQSGRAFLVGDTTFGKGLVQGFVSLPDGDGLRLTISRYYFDNNVYLNAFDTVLHDEGDGLAPDYYYSFPIRSPLIASLEGSLLLQEFTYANIEAILAAESPDDWEKLLIQLRIFAENEGFSFSSKLTDAVKKFTALVEEEKASPPLTRMADSLLQLSKVYDRQQILANIDYISTRLKQIAWEREYGLTRTYKEVIVPKRGDISLAEKLLLQSQS